MPTYLNPLFNKQKNNITATLWAASRENLSLGFATSSDSYQPAKLMRLARVLKFQLKQIAVFYYPGSEQQQILRGYTGWSAPLLFAYGISRFSHDMAHMALLHFYIGQFYGMLSINLWVSLTFQSNYWQPLDCNGDNVSFSSFSKTGTNK